MAETTSAPSLRELSEAATQGPWFAETEKSDGSYGSGEDTSEGYDTAVIMTEAETHYGKPGVLFESHNSTVGMIHEESDDESFRAWDAVSEANARFIVALVNDYRAGRLIDPTTLAEAVAAARAEGVREGLERAASEFDQRAEAALRQFRDAVGHRNQLRASHHRGKAEEAARIIRALIPAPPALTPGGRTDG